MHGQRCGNWEILNDWGLWLDMSRTTGRYTELHLGRNNNGRDNRQIGVGDIWWGNRWQTRRQCCFRGSTPLTWVWSTLVRLSTYVVPITYAEWYWTSVSTLLPVTRAFPAHEYSLLLSSGSWAGLWLIQGLGRWRLLLPKLQIVDSQGSLVSSSWSFHLVPNMTVNGVRTTFTLT